MESRVLMVGPSLSQRSGIASVEAAYFQSWNREAYDLRLVASYTSHYNPRLKKGAIALIALIRAAWLLAVWRPGIVHIHFAAKGSFFRKCAFILLTWLARYPRLILHCHAADFESFYFDSSSSIRALIRWAVARSNRLLVLSSSQKRFFEGIVPAHPIEIVTNPVDCPDAVSSQRQRMVLVLGELGTRKGTYDILEAIPTILDQCPDLVFVFGGDGDEERVKSLLADKPWKEHVQLLGWVGNSDKKRLLEKALIFLLPSYHEGLPVAILEAMAYGVPIVTSPVGGIPDLIENDRDGLLVRPGAVGEIVSAVTRLANNPPLREALSDRARARVINTCETRAVVNHLFSLYEGELLGRRTVPI